MYLSILKRIDALQEFINYDMINENSFTEGGETFFSFLSYRDQFILYTLRYLNGDFLMNLKVIEGV